MGENTQLNEQIKTLLDNSVIQPVSSYTIVNIRGSTLVGSSDTLEIVKNPEDYSFTNRQVVALKALYLQQTNPNKSVFENVMVNILKPGSDVVYAQTSVRLLLHIGRFSIVLSHIKANFSDYNQKIYIVELKVLSEFLCYEWNTISTNELRALRDWVNDCLSGKNKLGKEIAKWGSLYRDVISVLDKIYRQVNIILTKSLEKQIYSEFNPEINEDEKRLKEEFTQYGFPKDLSDCLEKIDQKFINASSDFDFKGCMDLIRSFTERLYKSIAISLDSTVGKDVRDNDSEEVAKFFISKNLISKDQGDILISLRHFLSNLGSHRIKSRQEDARLSRNMTIEFSLYLLKRLKSMQTE